MYSQKIKIKKETVSIDKKEVCKLAANKSHFKILSLKGEEVLNFDLESNRIETLEGDKNFQFLNFKNKADNKSYYSDYDLSDIKMSFSGKKMLIRHLIKKNQFLTTSSINYAKIKDFFSQPRPRSTQMDEAIAQYKEAYKAVEDFHLSFDGNKIYSGKNYVGRYKITPPNKNTNSTTIAVYDAKNFKTATFTGASIGLFDGNSIKFLLYSRDDVVNAQKIIKRMIIAGYTLGDMKAKKASMRMQKHKDAVGHEMKESVNIYDQKATVYDQEGKKITGVLSLEFKELESQKSGMSNMKNYGGVATLKTKKENGRSKFTTYRAKDGVRICLDDSEKCYQGISTIGMMAPKFNLEVATSGKLKLYKSKSFSYYVIKKADAEKGLIITASAIFKDDNSEKMFKKIFEYLKDCPDLKNKLNTAEINLKKEADLMKIINAYNACK